MLVLKRKEGEWIELVHKSGDTIRIRVCNIRSRPPSRLDMVFEDEARNYTDWRAEQLMKPPTPAAVSDPLSP